MLVNSVSVGLEGEFEPQIFLIEQNLSPTCGGLSPQQSRKRSREKGLGDGEGSKSHVEGSGKKMLYLGSLYSLRCSTYTPKPKN